jgi:hypothetical protein
MAISRLEKTILIVLTLCVWVVLAVYAGAPIFSDEFMYIDIGLRNYKEPSYGNRYFHVYLQKFFMDLAPTPLQGVCIFWGFIIALTAAMIYLNARTFFKDSHPLHGLLALAFFFSFPLITEYSGEPAVDLTAMLMVLIYISVYLWGLRNPDGKKKALAALGALAFLAFKTKETTIFVNMLLLGFVLDKDFRWQWKAIFEFIKPLLLGAAIGIFIFMLMDGFILGDPFFAIRPSTFGAIFTHYDFGMKFYDGPVSWYDEYFLDDLLLPFLLFLAGGLRLKDELDTQHKLVWIYPLVMAVFVTLNMIKIPWGFIERFYFPALPAVAMLAPQALSFDLPQKKKDWLIFALLMAGAGGLIWIMRSVLMSYAGTMYLEYTRILDSLYYPVLLTVLLGMLIWVKRWRWFSAALPLFCIAAMLFSPLLYSYKYFYTHPKISQRYEELVAPFTAFSEELALDEKDRMYVSESLDEELDVLSTDPNDIVGMYNFYFDARITDSNVWMGYSRRDMFKMLTTKDLSHALLTAEDWIWLQENAEDIEILTNMYDAQTDSEERFVLLKRK